MSDKITLLPPNATATERAFARVIGYESRINLGPKYRALWEPNGNPSSITINGIKFSSFHQGIDRNNYVLDIQVSESNSVEYAEKIGLGGERQKKLTIRYEIGITYSALSIIVNNLSAIAEEIKAEVVNDGVVSIDNGLYKLSGGTGCPYDTLPWLAWSLHVDEWDSNWTEQQKRDVIASSVAVHKTKGTIGALKRALAALGYEVTVDENTGEVYTFRLEFDLNQTGIIGTDTFAAARRVAMANKNARSKLLAVRSSLTANAGVYGAVAHHRAQTVTVDCGRWDLPPDEHTLLQVQVDAAGNIVERTGNGTITTTGTVIVDKTTTHDGYGSIRNTSAGSTTAAGYTRFTNLGISLQDFTVEGWCYTLNNSTSEKYWLHLYNALGNTCGYFMDDTRAGYKWLRAGAPISGAAQQELNYGDIIYVTWIHLALVRASGVMKFYVNGTAVAGTQEGSSIISINSIDIGSMVAPCCMENIRVSNIARYTENFTPQGRF